MMKWKLKIQWKMIFAKFYFLVCAEKILRQTLSIQSRKSNLDVVKKWIIRNKALYFDNLWYSQIKNYFFFIFIFKQKQFFVLNTNLRLCYLVQMVTAICKQKMRWFLLILIVTGPVIFLTKLGHFEDFIFHKDYHLWIIVHTKISMICTKFLLFYGSSFGLCISSE